MIKGGYFGKLLKQLFIILLISFFGLLASSFVKASALRPVGVYATSIYDNNYDIQVINKGSFLSSMLGTTKDVFILRDNDFFIWDDDGNLYIHFSRKYNGGINIIEGYPDYYFSCDELTGGSSSPSNCTPVNITSGSSHISIYSNFLKSVVSEDNYLYNISEMWDYNSVHSYQIYLCISSHSIGKSICWAGSYNSSNWVCPSFGGVCPTLHGSVNLGNVSFGQLNGYPSPAVIPGQIEGDSSVIDFNNNLTGDVVRVYCSNQRALDWYENNGYSNRLCYGGLNDFSTSTGVVPIAGQGLEFTDIRFELGGTYEGGVEGTGMSDIEFFSYWRSLYDLYKKGVYSTNPFNNVPTVLFTYFGFVDVYGGQFNNKSILEYCFLKNNLTGVSYNNNYNGVNYRNVCVNPILNYSSGVVNAVGGDWSGIISGGSNSSNTYTDGVKFIQDYFTQLKENYRKFNKGDIGFGFLPSYIILFLCALIVFRFISH